MLILQEMKTYLIFFFSILFISLFATTCKDKGKREGSSGGIEIITDRVFENGILVQGAFSAHPEPITTIYPFERHDNFTNWYLPQWGSIHLLENDNKIIHNDTVVFANEAKKISFYKTKKLSSIIGLEVFASKEYSAHRKLNQDWVHLLLEQKYTDFLYLKDISRLQYSIQAKLLYCDDKMGENFNSDLHTAQFTHFFTIQNRNENSLHFGDFFWFGLPLYDYRYKNIKEYAAEDLGKDDASKKFIFSVAGEELFHGSLHDYQWISIDKDILPLVKKAFFVAQERGYMQGTNFEEVCITSMNIGWEVPGTFDCGIIFETPKLKAYLK